MILDGTKLAEKILKEIKKKQLRLKLAVVLVGDDEASKTYVEKKREAAQMTGIGFELFEFEKDISSEDLEKEVSKISQREDITGMVIQLPLPPQIDTEKILGLIPPKKDVEGFVSDKNSPVVLAIKEILKEYDLSLEGKNVLVIGKGRLVGQPAAKWLKKENIPFEVVDKSVEDLSSFTKKADVIITGTGAPHLIKEDMVKRGVVIIDAGTCKIEGKTMGDVDFKNVCSKAKCITPCVGGIGPLTVACLLKNLTALD